MPRLRARPFFIRDEDFFAGGRPDHKPCAVMYARMPAPSPRSAAGERKAGTAHRKRGRRKGAKSAGFWPPLAALAHPLYIKCDRRSPRSHDTEIRHTRDAGNCRNARSQARHWAMQGDVCSLNCFQEAYTQQTQKRTKRYENKTQQYANQSIYAGILQTFCYFRL
jgi:hypothetical protein